MALWQTFKRYIARDELTKQQQTIDELTEIVAQLTTRSHYLNRQNDKLQAENAKLTQENGKLRSELITSMQKNVELMERQTGSKPNQPASPTPDQFAPRATQTSAHPADTIRSQYIGEPTAKTYPSFDPKPGDKPLFLDEVNQNPIIPPAVFVQAQQPADTFGFPQDTSDINAQQSAALGNLGTGATELSRGAVWGPPDTPEPMPFFETPTQDPTNP